MAADTRYLNQQADHLKGRSDVWLFGYGSLIYKVDFPYLESRPASIRGWVRRFWQASHDHRGTPEAPGRVLTLVEQPGATCVGLAYRVTPDVFDHLDHREKNGYLRLEVTLEFSEPTGAGEQARGLFYRATEENAAWLGEATEEAIARQIAGASGPSGTNTDYVLRLDRALRALNATDPHVSRIAGLLRRGFE